MTCCTFPLSTRRHSNNCWQMAYKSFEGGTLTIKFGRDFLKQLSYNRDEQFHPGWRNIKICHPTMITRFHENSLCNLTLPLSLHCTKKMDLTKSLRGVPKNTRSENITKITHWVKNGWLHVVGSFSWDFFYALLSYRLPNVRLIDET